MKNFFLLLILISKTITQDMDTEKFSLSILSDLSISSKDSAFNSSGLEFVIMGKVKSNAMVMAYATNHLNGEPTTIEEVYIDFVKLSPLIKQFKFGYYRPHVGILNKQHSHTFNFISIPNAVNYLFGPHAWSSLGFSIGVSLPLSWKNKLNIDLLQNSVGESTSTQGHYHGSPSAYADSVKGFSSTITFKQNINLSENQTLSLGVNSISGRGKTLNGYDLQFIQRINQYRSITIQGEYFSGNISNLHHGITYHPNELLKSGYIMVSRQFDQKYHLGFIADYWSYRLKDEKGISKWVYGAYAPNGENFVIRFKLAKDELFDEKSFNVIINATWSLGPHKPQRY
jgi:hypothetical protein